MLPRIIIERWRICSLSSYLPALLLAGAALVLVPMMIHADPAAGFAKTLSAAQIDRLGVALEDAMQVEIAETESPSVGVALFDRGGVIWSGAAGFADRARTVRATAQTLFRAGSVTKPLTELVMLQLVERGVLDLDAPVTRYLPDFAPKNPYGVPITLRLLATHRAGLVREPPVGSYFDTSAPDIDRVVRSLNQTSLIAKPGTLTKYSNAGVVVIGRIMEVVTGKSYAQLMQTGLFDPAGMHDSTMDLETVKDRLAYAEMGAYDEPRYPAPVFQIGLVPAGAMTTTLTDLSRIGSILLRGGVLDSGERLLSQQSFDAMTHRQFKDRHDPNGFGIGFVVVPDFHGYRLVTHAGAIYGYLTDFKFFPDVGVGVVAFSTQDIGVSAAKLSNYALQTVWSLLQGKAVEPAPRTGLFKAAEALRMAGDYRRGNQSVNVRWMNEHLFIETPKHAAELRRTVDGGAVMSGLDTEATVVDPRGAWLTIDGKRYQREASNRAPPRPPAMPLLGLLGDYGWDQGFIRVFERDAQPYVRIEGVDYCAMKVLDADTWQFPADGSLYPRETLRFTRDAAGRGVSVSLNGIVHPRRAPLLTGAGIDPAAIDRDKLRAVALAAHPPLEGAPRRQPDLVDVLKIDPSLRLDIRYAGSNNFLGFPVYRHPVAYLQRPAAEALAKANRALRSLGYGILVHDAYRPWYVTKMFWDATPEPGRIFVANPAEGSRHNRGAAVDVSLFEISSGRPVEMTGDYDEMSPRSYARYDGGTSAQRWLREQLREAMQAQGFEVYPWEWWHFDYRDWSEYPISNRVVDE